MAEELMTAEDCRFFAAEIVLCGHDCGVCQRYARVAATYAECARLRAALTEREGECERLREDAARLDWLERTSWVTLDKTDESDNNGAGLLRSSVVLRSSHPDGERFAAIFSGSSRAALDAARGPRTGGE